MSSIVVALLLAAACGGAEDGDPSDVGVEPAGSASPAEPSAAANGSIDDGGVCDAMVVDLELLALGQTSAATELSEIERAPADARWLNVPGAVGCFAGFADTGSTLRSATMEAYVWSTEVIDATQFADVFADRQPGRLRDEPHPGLDDVAHLITIDREGEPASVLALVVERDDRVLYVQSGGLGLDPAPIDQVAAVLLDAL